MNITEKIQEVIVKVAKHRTLYSKNEQAVRNHLIDPVLEALGWDTSNPDLVKPEEKDENDGKPDYILYKNDDQRVLIVEAKNLSVSVKDEKVIKQLADYCYHRGIEFGLITNGLQWILFNTFERDPKKRITWAVDFEKDEHSFVSNRLIEVSYNNIDQLSVRVQNLEKLKKLEVIWENTFREKSDVFAVVRHVIRDKCRELGLESSYVDDFVGLKLTNMFEPVTDNLILKKENPLHNYIQENEVSELKSFDIKQLDKIKATFPDGTVFFFSKVVDTFSETIKKIGIEKVKALNIAPHGLQLIDRKLNNKKYQQRRISEDYYLQTTLSTEHKFRILKIISEQLNLDLRIEKIKGEDTEEQQRIFAS